MTRRLFLKLPGLTAALYGKSKLIENIATYDNIIKPKPDTLSKLNISGNFLHQDIKLIPGKMYKLSYDVINTNPENLINISINNGKHDVIKTHPTISGKVEQVFVATDIDNNLYINTSVDTFTPLDIINMSIIPIEEDIYEEPSFITNETFDISEDGWYKQDNNILPYERFSAKYTNQGRRVMDMTSRIDSLGRFRSVGIYEGSGKSGHIV